MLLLPSIAAFSLAILATDLDAVAAASVADETVRFALANGLVVLLAPDPAAEQAIVMLGVKAGVLDEPEGRNGLAHLAEHLFLHGGTQSAAAGESFAKLAEGGPIGQPFSDVNAETLPNLTYFYALRRANEVALPLQLLAEKLDGVRFDDALLEIERAKALAEIESVEKMLDGNPALRAQMRILSRHPKAGTIAELRAVTSDQVRAFLATHYRPERCVLLVAGAFDAVEVRKQIEERFGVLRAPAKQPLADVEELTSDGGKLWRAPQDALAGADPALCAVLASAWQRSLRATKKRAFVELAPSGTMRAWIEGEDAALLTSTLEALRTPLAEKEWKRVLKDSGADARHQRSFAAQALPKLPERQQQLLAHAQREICRLRFEIEGGEPFLERLSTLTPEQLAELAASIR
ncbi:MAG: insulinase family protein [Planctomycetes bacterium]|nr:insulinase family protein [Planctomycetota bacterium]